MLYDDVGVFMKSYLINSKYFILMIFLLFMGIIFFIESCSNSSSLTSININLDLSKILKTSRNPTSLETNEYILKIYAYDASNYKKNDVIENLPVLSQTQSNVNVNGIVKSTLDVPIGYNVIFMAKIFLFVDNFIDDKPLYSGSSEILKIKPMGNKIHLNLIKTHTDIDIDINIEETQYFTVTFDSKGGNDIEKQSVKYGTNVTEPSSPTKQGYVFSGWYTSKDDGKTLDILFNFDTLITNDITLYALWIENENTSYTVEHYQQNILDNNYSIFETENKTGITGEQTLAEAKKYVGFTEKTFEQLIISPDESTVVKIYYDRNMYTVSFDSMGSNSIESQTVKYEGCVKIPNTSPNREEYEFLGWYASDDDGKTISEISFNFNTPIVENLVLYAKYKVIEKFIFVEGTTIKDNITATGFVDSDIFVSGTEVIIPSFYISDHEVTQGEYKTYCSYKNSSPTSSYGLGDNYPAYYVSMFDAFVYCNKRSFAEGRMPCYTIKNSTDPEKWGDPVENETDWLNIVCDFTVNGYRLPTEEEWEYAARGGNNLSSYQYKYSGSDSIDEVAFYSSNSKNTTHEVKLKKPNELGIYDMSGNLYEFCFSIYPDIPNNYCIRGGSITNNESYCTVKSNNFTAPNGTGTRNYGFRIVYTAE